jgi:hypothetical protein
MANLEQLEILKQGVDVWNKWRGDNHDATINLSRANLAGVDLKNADLASANLWQAKLLRADLRRAYLSGANLRNANLESADLRNADLALTNLRETYLVEANLRKANLTESNLTETYLQNSDLTDSYFGDTLLGKVDLRSVIGLEFVVHYGPSTIGTNTIQRSWGEIPIQFLRGCGLSDLEIEFAKLAAPNLSEKEITDITYKIHDLRAEGIAVQYYSAFISYSSKDKDFAQKLYNELQNKGVRCWFAPEDIKIGDKIRPRIDQEIRLRDKLLVILSENSVRSEWVGDEVEAALEEESASGRLVLFPIRLDDAVIETRDDWAAKIKRRRHIGNFSNWKDEGSYQKAFERLLRDLKVAGGEAGESTSNNSNNEL